ncbi:MAG: homogentisate 1,2-dioxygenase [Proteobacteria bacterium]|nr:homogentisate 1,2-dioxygenase [Pseudomonadota bacterium]
MSNRRGLTFPRVAGRAPRQAHCDLPDETYEREFGREGFFGPASHLLHAHPPTGWIEWEGPLRPRAFDLGKLEKLEPSPWDADAVLVNAHCRMRLWRVGSDMDHLVRNADGDELLFVHAGAGDLFCDFGHLAWKEGDYLVLPRGLQWRVEVTQPATLLLIEATNDGYSLPERGLVGQHAFFDPAMLAVPELNETFGTQRARERWQVVIKRDETLSRVTFPFNPLDTVGWQGDLLPARINWRDLRPLISDRYHLPPSAHTTFLCKRFVVCTFCPRPIESDPGALKVPFFHNNNDYDEVIFYHRGSFFSRDDVRPGMLTLHPAGFAHGPHPRAFRAGQKAAREATDEVAVMVDTRDALAVTAKATSVEWTGYVESWKRKDSG